MENGFDIIQRCMDFAINIYNRIDLTVPFWATLLGLFFVYCVIKFFIAPFIGQNHMKNISQSVTDTRLTLSKFFRKGGGRNGS